MADQMNEIPEQRRTISGRMLLLCLSGLLINLTSALAAALGGYRTS